MVLPIVISKPITKNKYVEKFRSLTIFHGIKIDGIMSPKKQAKVGAVWFIIRDGINVLAIAIAVSTPAPGVQRKRPSIFAYSAKNFVRPSEENIPGMVLRILIRI